MKDKTEHKLPMYKNVRLVVFIFTIVLIVLSSLSGCNQAINPQKETLEYDNAEVSSDESSTLDAKQEGEESQSEYELNGQTRDATVSGTADDVKQASDALTTETKMHF